MSQLFVIGRVTADLELQESTNKTAYVRFDLAENIGYGETRHPQYYQVWAWAGDAMHLLRQRVKKGSLIWASGSLILETYVKKDGTTKDKRLKLTLDNWGYVPVGKPVSTAQNFEDDPVASPSPTDSLPHVGKIDGDREALPD
ncbi:single-stranded DNA-binding protein [Caproiciproducens sp. R1]|uniref:single-stranded DNA-binding protein n=1 Tax=Acutalibacteraceae TaxID=3082771 RepID=UPI002E0DBFFD